MTLATDTGPMPMNVAAVLALDADPRRTRLDAGDSAALPSEAAAYPGASPSDLAALQDLLVARIGRISRFRQVLVDVPWGLGRPIWLHDDSFDPRAHVTTRRCPEPGDQESLLALAAHEAIQPLPRNQPLWRAILVHGLSGARLGVILIVHHVLTDGVGGLAVLAALADGAPSAPAPPSSCRSMPSTSDLARDNLAHVLRSLRGLPVALRELGRARSELGADRPRPGRSERSAPRCSLNSPVSGWLHVAALEVDLAPLIASAHEQGATLNDLLLVAVTGAMESVLRSRGEQVAALVVSVPISARPTTTSQELGNRVGVMPVRVALAGSLAERVRAVADATSAQKGTTRGSSTALLWPVFRGLAALGIFIWFVNRQRLINTILSNLHGPASPMRFGGRIVSSVIPVSALAGNVPVGFTALSYAGRLVISVATDPVRVPESRLLIRALTEHLGTFTSHGHCVR